MLGICIKTDKQRCGLTLASGRDEWCRHISRYSKFVLHFIKSDIACMFQLTWIAVPNWVHRAHSILAGVSPMFCSWLPKTAGQLSSEQKSKVHLSARWKSLMSWEIIENARLNVYLIRGLSFIEVLFRFGTVGSGKDSGGGEMKHLIGSWFWAPMGHRNSLGSLVAFDASQQLLPIAV